MEVLKNLIGMLRRTGVLLLIGLLLIIYVALGFVYWQQGAEQQDLQGQITKLSLVVSRPLPSAGGLQAEYEEINDALAPMTDSEAIALLVSIAEKSGIDVEESAGKLRIPSASSGEVTVGGGRYRVISFGNVRVQGDHDSVMAFISDLDSGKTLKSMVLTAVTTSEVEIAYVGEQKARRDEFRDVAAAVEEMMADNSLYWIPNPTSLSGGVAVNLMGDDPDTGDTVEGFPDITTTAVERGYTGTGSPQNGYVLYGHHAISTDNSTVFETEYYIDMLTTSYYYTCESDGRVRQFSEADLHFATEYLGSASSRIEIVATLSVSIYIKP